MENKTTPIISVIVPIYKVEQYLHRCIDSILAQTFTDFELILIDDGSPDNCGTICDDYAAKDDRIRVIHKKNGGVAAARNTALDVVTSQFVTFCDSDDSYAPDWLETLIWAIEEKCADVVLGNYTRQSEDGEKKVIWHECGTYSTKAPEEKVQYCIEKVLGGKHGWEIWNRLFRTEIIQTHGIRFCCQCKNFAEDLGFVMEYMLYADSAVSIEHAGYFYQVRNGSMMSNSREAIKLDELNEVSLHFATAFRKAFPTAKLQKMVPIFHFLILYNQYQKILWTDRYSVLGQELRNIRRYKEWEMQTKALFRCKNELASFFGKTNAQKLLLFSHYCLHGNWNRFRYESAIAYRWLIKEE